MPATSRSGCLALTVALTVLAVTALAGCDRGTGACRPVAASPAPAPAPVVAPAPVLDAAQREVLGNMLAQPIGGRTLADDRLPEPFLVRIADRIIRESYQQQVYAVFDDIGLGPMPEIPPPPGRPDGVRVVTADLPPGVVTVRRAIPVARPIARGFRANALGAWTPSGTAPRDDTDRVARRLPRDGIIATLVHALAGMGLVERSVTGAADALEAAGFPIDLLRHFTVAGADVLDVAHGRLAEGAAPDALATELGATASFRFLPSRRGFRIATESGEHDIAAVRAQATRGTHWRAAGSGGNLDVLRQLVGALPDARFTVSMQARHLEPFLATAAAWPIGDARRLTVVTEPLVVAQWAQDNGKAGTLDTEDGPGLAPATLVPRFASRRDDGSEFVPGESSLVDGLEAAGHAVIRSPLLFQGGNLLAVRAPVSGERLLLVGESAIHRNVPLGLTPAQVIQALTVELGVDRCIVVPSVSFHLDYDVSVRAHDDALVAIVNDPLPAADLVVGVGIDALETAGVLETDEAAAARSALDRGERRRVLDLVGSAVGSLVTARGLPLSLALHFADDPADSPPGNLQCFLVALDILSAMTLAPDEIAALPQAAYLQAYRRIDERRLALHAQLAGLGWTVVPVPSMSDGARGLNAVNGIHDRTRYLMPAHGGFYARVDEAAAAVLRGHLSGVEIVPIASAESQRRSGAVHCSVGVSPRTPAR